MRVKLREICDAQAGLATIMQTNQPPGTAFHLVDLVQAISPKIANFNKQRLAWINELGEERPGGEGKHVPTNSANWPEFERRFNELMDTEVELPGIDPLPRDSFGKTDLSPGSLMAIGPFIAKPAPATLPAESSPSAEAPSP